MSIHQYETKLAEQVSESLVSIGAIKISPKDPFTWASGWKSPIYCDNRLSLSYPDSRKLITDSLSKIIREKFSGAEVIAGVATAGIPQGALVADALGLPFIYVRNKTKGHGLENQIEGVCTKGAKVVLIEDLVSTGGSSLQAAEAIRSSGMEVLGMAAIFTYGFSIADDNFASHNIELWYLSNYHTLINMLADQGKIKKAQLATLEAWRSNPAQWGEQEKEPEQQEDR